MPARGALNSFCIFIDSSTTTISPVPTGCPSLTSTLTTTPGIGALTSTSPTGATGPRFRPANRRVRSSWTLTSKRPPHKTTRKSSSPSSMKTSYDLPLMMMEYRMLYYSVMVLGTHGLQRIRMCMLFIYRLFLNVKNGDF